jgi:hypothetical protein
VPSFKFHFQEIDWVIYLPGHGNEGRDYEKYGVAYRDRRRGRSQTGRRVSLKDALSKSEIRGKYPHTVGFFLASSGKGSSWRPDYLRVKKVRRIKEFYDFLKELSL